MLNKLTKTANKLKASSLCFSQIVLKKVGQLSFKTQVLIMKTNRVQQQDLKLQALLNHSDSLAGKMIPTHRIPQQSLHVMDIVSLIFNQQEKKLSKGILDSFQILKTMQSTVGNSGMMKFISACHSLSLVIEQKSKVRSSFMKKIDSILLAYKLSLNALKMLIKDGWTSQQLDCRTLGQHIHDIIILLWRISQTFVILKK